MSLEDLDEIANGRWSKYNGTLTVDEINAARAFRENDYKLSREVDRNGNRNGWLDDEGKTSSGGSSNNPHNFSSETHKTLLDKLREKAGSPMSLQDLDEIANGKWSKYNGTLTADEINAAKVFKENDYKLSREVDQNGNKNGLLDDESKTSSSGGNKGATNYKEARKAIEDRWGGTNGLINYVKEKTGATGEYITPEHIRMAMVNEQDPVKKTDLQYFHDYFGDIDKSKDTTRHTNGTDGRIGAGDLEKYFGWPMDPKNGTNILAYDTVQPELRKAFGGANGLVNYIKEKSGTTDLYLTPGDVRKATDAETDPAKKAVMEYFYGHFGDVDKKKGQHYNSEDSNGTDGRIGAGDIQQYFGWPGDSTL